jgi:hypothetical protein
MTDGNSVLECKTIKLVAATTSFYPHHPKLVYHKSTKSTTYLLSPLQKRNCSLKNCVRLMPRASAYYCKNSVKENMGLDSTVIGNLMVDICSVVDCKCGFIC